MMATNTWMGKKAGQKIIIFTPTRCKPTAEAAHVLAMHPVFPGICQGQKISQCQSPHINAACKPRPRYLNWYTSDQSDTDSSLQDKAMSSKINPETTRQKQTT